MPSTSAVLPTGHRVRTTSKSPMVLFAVPPHGVAAPKPFIVKRSASRETLMKERRRLFSQARAFIIWTDGTGRVEEV